MDALIQVVGIIIPMLGICGSAVAFVLKYYSESTDRRNKEFFFLMQTIDGGGTIAAKLAAVYSLRNFPEHKDFIVRFCASQQSNISGGGSEYLRQEMEATRIAMSSSHQP